MLVALRLSTRIRLFLKLDNVAVYVHSSRGFADKFSWKENRLRERYFPGHEELGDISVLYNKNFVAGNVSHLVKICTRNINAFVETRNLPKAQSLFDLMIKKEVEPDVYTYTVLMKGYSRLGNTEKVYELFKEMEKKGIKPSVVTFSTAIRAYASSGDLEGAQFFFEKMKDSYRLEPDAYTYNAMLNVCVTARNLERARILFAEMNSSNVRQNKVTVTTMIDVYAECCNEKRGKQFLEECKDLLKEMEKKGVAADEQTYSTLLKLCSRGSLTADSIRVLNEMRSNHMNLGVIAYSIVLDGISKDYNLSNEEVLELSSKIVSDMNKKEVHPDATSFTSLITVALRVGELSHADRLFREMKTLKVKPTVVTYGAMIKCYEKLGDPEDGAAYLKPCLDLWHECEKAGMKMDAEGYTSLLSACANTANFDQASRIWKKMISVKIKPDVFAHNAMINVCISARNMDKAISLFIEMKTRGILPNSVTYATMIKCYEKLGDPKDGDTYLKPCLDLLEECKQAGLKMDAIGYTSLLSACANVADLDQALRIWNKMIADERELTVSVYNAIINVCVNAGNLEKTVSLATEMKAKGIALNLVTYSTLIKCYEKLGDPEEGDVYLERCLNLWCECERAGMCMTEEGYTSLLSACAKASNIDQALRIWTRMISDKIKQTAFAYSAMINVCVSAGSFNKALSFFKGMKTAGITPNSVTYGTMIKCYEKLGDSTDGYACLESCLGLWHECEQAGMNLTIEGYTSLLSACAKAADLDQASNVWDKMIVDKIKPDVVVYTAMINVCLSKDNEDMAFDFFDEMKTSGIKPNVVTFGTLISYFEKNKDRAGAEKIHAAMKIQGVQPDKAILRMLRALGIE